MGQVWRRFRAERSSIVSEIEGLQDGNQQRKVSAWTTEREVLFLFKGEEEKPYLMGKSQGGPEGEKALFVV